MTRATAKFDWSMLDRKGLTQFLAEISPKLVGQELTNTKFHSIISKHIRSQLPVKVVKRSDTKVEFNQVYTGGAYYSDDDKDRNRQCIEIVFVYNPIIGSVCITQHRFRKMCSLFADTILHELMHMRQYRSRKFKELPDYASSAEKTEQRLEQEYLGNPDEIDAYGFNIACELMDKFKGNEYQVIEYLSEDQKGLRRRYNSWRMYLKAFDHDHNHIIIKRLKKKVVRYIPYAELGKPYRGKDWISR
jgi:hypothetical protein